MCLGTPSVMDRPPRSPDLNTTAVLSDRQMTANVQRRAVNVQEAWAIHEDDLKK